MVNVPRSRDKPAVQLVGICFEQGEEVSVESLYQAPDLTSTEPRAFDIDCGFASLHMTGKLANVLVRESFDDDEAKIAAKVTRYKLDYSDCAWRKVCAYERPNEICGWACFEDPGMVRNSACHAQTGVLALHVSTISGVPDGFSLGFLRITHSVLNVLFVRAIGGRRYQRIGVGRLFGKEAHRAFHTVMSQDIKLI
jgi:hypothetical protein